ncbi:MAG: hypothetical protein ACOX0L_05620 [Natronincolaceae bacterium]
MKEYLLIFLIIFAILSVMRAFTRLREDLSYTNYILNKVAVKLGAIDEDVDIELKQLLKKGDRVRAIKLYMTLSRKDFKEAEDYINNLSKNL